MNRTEPDELAQGDPGAASRDFTADDANLDLLVGQSSLGSRAARELRQRTDPARRIQTWLDARESSNEAITLHPHTYADARGIGEHYRRGEKPVIVNLTSMSDDDGKRVLDYMAGLTFALSGRIERIAFKIFMLTQERSPGR